MEAKDAIDRKDVLIFVDANIYLDCYQRRYDNYRSLLASLAKLSDILLYTSAVHDEFRRNRVSAYSKENKLVHVKGNIAPVEVHHGSSASDVYKDINKRKNAISDDVKKLIKEIAQIHENNIIAIATGDDDVSKVLQPIVDNVKIYNDDQLNRARKRKEIGNPPGKRSDPLGDQISWEQLLDAIKDKKSIWIVSNDGDYLEKIGKTLLLNPLLSDEIKSKNNNTVVYCFDNLADFFSSFNNLSFIPEDAKISVEVLKDAKKEFTANTAVKSEKISLQTYRGPITVSECPGTDDGMHVFIENDSIPKPSIYGGWSYWQVCQRCGANFDTGEPYDD